LLQLTVTDVSERCFSREYLQSMTYLQLDTVNKYLAHNYVFAAKLGIIAYWVTAYTFPGR